MNQRLPCMLYKSVPQVHLLDCIHAHDLSDLSDLSDPDSIVCQSFGSPCSSSELGSLDCLPSSIKHMPESSIDSSTISLIQILSYGIDDVLEYGRFPAQYFDHGSLGQAVNGR